MESLSKSIGIDFLESNSALETMAASIKSTKKGQTIVIKMQTWRADSVGVQMGQSCLQALENGAKIIIFKDDIGIPFELGESTGYSFFPEKPSKNIGEAFSKRVQKVKARVMRGWYEKPIPDDSLLEKSSRISYSLDRFRQSGQFQLIKEKRYDHSKLVLKVDEEGRPLRAFVGGVTFGKEFKKCPHPEGYTSDSWADGMLDISDPNTLGLIKKSLCGEEASDNGLGMEIISNPLGKETRSYNDAVIEAMRIYRERILIACPYMGNIRIIEALEDAENVEAVIPEVSNWAKDRTRNFFWELARRTNKGFDKGFRGALEEKSLFSYWKDFILKSRNEVPFNLTVKFSRRMLHLKAMVLNRSCAVIGSGNFSETYGWGIYDWMDSLARFQELGVILDANKNPELNPIVKKIEDYVNSLVTPESRYPARAFHRNWILREIDSSQGKNVSHFSLLFAQVEHLGLSFQQFMMYFVRQKKLQEQREQEKEIFKSLFLISE